MFESLLLATRSNRHTRGKEKDNDKLMEINTLYVWE